ALRSLRDEADDTSRALTQLSRRAVVAAAALRLLGTQASRLRGNIDDLDGSIRRLGAGITGLPSTFGTVPSAARSAGGAVDELRSAALLLGPALIPIAAQALPIAAGLGAAAAAVGAFAAAAAGQVVAISEAAEAGKKYKEAVEEHGRTSKEAAEADIAWQRQLAEVPPQTRVAAAALSVLKDEYEAWSDELSSSTMPIATRQFQIFGALFPKLTPLVRGTSTQLMRFQEIMAGGIQSPGFDRFMNRFADFASSTLAKANDAIIRFTRTLDTGQVGGGVAAFMDYARENGPLVRDTLAKIGEALANVLEGAANV